MSKPTLNDSPVSEDLYLTGAPARILFIRPPAVYANLKFPDGPRVGTPLGMLYLAGLFKESMGIETRIIDALVHADLENLYNQEPPYFFGMKIDEIVEQAVAFNPTIIAMSSNFGYFLDNAVATITALRKRLPDAFIVAGGADVTVQPEAYLTKSVGLDCAGIGEGEIIMRNLVGRLRHNKPWKDLAGLAYLENGKLVKNCGQAKIKELDAYEIDYSKIDLEAYFKLYEKGFPARVSYDYPGSHRAVSMVTSRGCPFKCVFCSIHLHMGYAFRWHSAENVVNHIKLLVEKYDVRHFHFEDDNLTLHKPRFKKILQGIIDHNLNITWDTPNGVRADLLDRELVELSKKTGCVYLMFGVESGNQEVVDKIVKKDLDLKKLIEAAKLCHEVGLDTAAFYIFGFPGETKRNIEETNELAFELFKKYKTRPHVNIARPLKGTELYETAKAANVLIDTETMDPQDRYEGPKTLIGPQMIETQDFSLEYLTETFMRYQRNFLKYSVLNWLEAAARNPIVFGKSILGMFGAMLARPTQAKTTAYRYFLRRFIFPHAMVRRELLARAKARGKIQDNSRLGLLKPEAGVSA